PEAYYFVTIHRPYNTDDPERMKRILRTLNELDHKVIFPIHPRTLHRLAQFGIEQNQFPNIHFTEPSGYVESVSYQKYAEVVITDSGGMQKEAYILGKKCITLRSETEWTETLHHGWNTLVFEQPEDIRTMVHQPCGEYIPGIYGNGQAAEEITGLIKKHL
ncbi:MAG TPA: UDP-N-acetylglucosamine 2-epimerase, partial [Chitinophagaceae bacterium]|nr:UDP-N-acetylglucosamine 2-epimerase [Chitinophagaceae bacterium]